MKYIHLIFLFISFSFSLVSAQGLFKTNDLINSNLIIYLNEVKNRNLPVYISTDYYPPSFVFDETIKNMKIDFIDINNFKNKILKKGADVLFFDGISMDENRLRFIYSIRNVQNKKKNQWIYIKQTRHFIYEYSKETNEWVLLDIVSEL